ncbi:alcohol dehydrogenase catalytic domain-containing protein [Microbacterium sp. RD1]|uniref:alcohol dehydrogenase catalytic domain-containing protein n=1 Tax=Microbacterium sp. RD1 TaxID=3457313 RepID=UPI003FA53360
MIAIRFHDSHPGEVFVDEISEPSPGEGEVLVRLEASALNPADLKIRNGLIRPRGGEAPWTLGWDLVGRVHSGAGFHPGARVLGMSTMASTGRGTWAELVALPATALAPAPEHLEASVLAPLPLVGLTALQAVDVLAPEPGDDVLVVGARGAVGSLVVRMLEARGVAPRSAVRGDEIRPSSADIVVDAAGVDNGAAVRPGGRYIALVPATEPSSLPDGSAPTVVRASQSGAGLSRLLALVADGVIPLSPPRVFALEEAAAAFAAFERRDGRRVALVTGGAR